MASGWFNQGKGRLTAACLLAQPFFGRMPDKAEDSPVTRLDYESDVNVVEAAVRRAVATYDSPMRSARMSTVPATELALGSVLDEGPPVVVLHAHVHDNGLALETSGIGHGRIAPLLARKSAREPGPLQALVRGKSSDTAPAIFIMGPCKSLTVAHMVCSAGVPFVVATGCGATHAVGPHTVRRFLGDFLQCVLSKQPGGVSAFEFIKHCFDTALQEAAGPAPPVGTEARPGSGAGESASALAGSGIHLVTRHTPEVVSLLARKGREGDGATPGCCPPAELEARERGAVDRIRLGLAPFGATDLLVDSQLDHQPWFVPSPLQPSSEKDRARERDVMLTNAEGLANIYGYLAASSRDSAGQLVGVLGWPRTGTTSIAMAIARHARWRDHFSGGVFFVPVGDISVAACLEELPPDGDFEPWELEAQEEALGLCPAEMLDPVPDARLVEGRPEGMGATGRSRSSSRGVKETRGSRRSSAGSAGSNAGERGPGGRKGSEESRAAAGGASGAAGPSSGRPPPDSGHGSDDFLVPEALRHASVVESPRVTYEGHSRLWQGSAASSGACDDCDGVHSSSGSTKLDSKLTIDHASGKGCASGAGAGSVDGATLHDAPDFWHEKRHRLLRRLKGCICAGILRHLHRLQTVGVEHIAIGEWVDRYHRIRACRAAGEVGEELQSWQHVLVLLDGMDTWWSPALAVKARYAAFTDVFGASASEGAMASRQSHFNPELERDRYRGAISPSAGSDGSTGTDSIDSDSDSVSSSESESSGEMESSRFADPLPDAAADPSRLPVLELLLGLLQGGRERRKVGGTSVLYTAKVGSLLGQGSVPRCVGDPEHYRYVACGLMPRHALQQAAARVGDTIPGGFRGTADRLIDPRLVGGSFVRTNRVHFQRIGGDVDPWALGAAGDGPFANAEAVGRIQAALGHSSQSFTRFRSMCCCAPVALRALQEPISDGLIEWSRDLMVGGSSPLASRSGPVPYTGRGVAARGSCPSGAAAGSAAGHRAYIPEDDTGFFIDIKRRQTEVVRWMQADGDVHGRGSMTAGLLALWRQDLRCHTSFGRIWKHAIYHEWASLAKDRAKAGALPPKQPRRRKIGMGGGAIQQRVVARHVLEGTIYECQRIVGTSTGSLWFPGSAVKAIDMECLYRSAMANEEGDRAPVAEIFQTKVHVKPGEKAPYREVRMDTWRAYWAQIEPTMRRTAKIPRLWELRCRNPGAFAPFADGATASQLLAHSSSPVRARDADARAAPSGEAVSVTQGIVLVRFSSQSGCIVVQPADTPLHGGDELYPMRLELSVDGLVSNGERWVPLHEVLENMPEYSHVQFRLVQDGTLAGVETMDVLTGFLRHGK